MRPQNGKRGRSRGRNKGGNQLNRTLESNGPDVKIRGTAAHIYEKYQTLARDANSSGDRITAENYLQHAEHYYRVMMSAQPPQAAQNQPVGDAASDEQNANAGGSNNRGRRSANQDAPAEAADGPAAEQTSAVEEPAAAAEATGETGETEKEAQAGENTDKPEKPAKSTRGGRRLNGRSRRVNGEGRGSRAIKSLEESEAAEEPKKASDEDKPSSSGSDEAVV